MKIEYTKKMIGSFLLMISSLGIMAQSVSDGPYVVYRDGKAIVKNVVSGVASESPIVNGKVNVVFPEKSDWNFSVPLLKELRTESSVFVQPEKMFVVSDIEGQFDGFRKLLIVNGVMDEKYNWTYGKGHLVICGDLFDRGLSVTESIWLIYKMEDLARAAGGYVHTILGNHDIMNMSGDLRYVQPKYLEAAKIIGMEYVTLYGVDTEIGRWLRTKNTIEKIGDNLCLHAGVSPVINKLGLSLEEINTFCRPYYDKVKVFKGVGDVKIDPLFKSESSLFWYRGYFFDPKATEEEVSETLRVFGVKRIIAGHTIVPGNVAFYYGGKVLGVDVNRHAGDHQAAVFENGKWEKVNDKGERKILE